MEQLLFPDIDKTPADYEAMYPPRNLGEGAKVTRFAPSPTGFLHFGSLLFTPPSSEKLNIEYQQNESGQPKQRDIRV